MKPTPDSASVDQKKKRLYNTDMKVTMEMKTSTDMFETWTGSEQVEFLCRLLPKMDHFQQSQVNDFLEPLLKRDFIVALRDSGVLHLAEYILSHLDATSLLSVELVSKGWQHSVASCQLWRRLLLRRVTIDPVWYGLAERRGWLDLIRCSDFSQLPTSLEQRRIAMNLRQNLSEMPLLTALQTYNPVVCSKAYDAQTWLPQLLPSFKLNVQPDCNNSQSVGLMLFAHRFYKQLYPRIIKDLKRVEDNWRRGNYQLTRIPCRSDVTKGVYCLQYDNEKIVSGLRDDTIKVWRRIDRTASQQSHLKSTGACVSRLAIVPHCSSALGEAGSVNRPVPIQHQNSEYGSAGGNGRGGEEAAVPVPRVEAAAAGDGSRNGSVSFVSDATIGTDGYKCTQIMEGHSGSVLCLQYIGHLLISGSSDTTVRLWDLTSGRCLNVISHHSEAVLHLRFQNNVLVTCSKDRSIAVWDMGPYPKDVQLRQVLVGHRAAVNVVDFDEKYIVSASGDRTIKVWFTDTCGYVRTLSGHRRGIACLQYRDRLIVSGSSDNTIRIWDIETGVCFRVLEGHEELVRCIRFDSKRIVSGAYDGKIKIWDLKAALNPRSKPNQLCVHTLQQHTGRVFRLQFDDFQIVSSSHDDSILIWDFARPHVDNEDLDDGYDDGIQGVLVPQAMNCTCPSMSTPAATPAGGDPVSDVPSINPLAIQLPVPGENLLAFIASCPHRQMDSEAGPACAPLPSAVGESNHQSITNGPSLLPNTGGDMTPPAQSPCQCLFHRRPSHSLPEESRGDLRQGSEPPPPPPTPSSTEQQHLDYP